MADVWSKARQDTERKRENGDKVDSVCGAKSRVGEPMEGIFKGTFDMNCHFSLLHSLYNRTLFALVTSRTDWLA